MQTIKQQVIAICEAILNSEKEKGNTTKRCKDVFLCTKGNFVKMNHNLTFKCGRWSQKKKEEISSAINALSPRLLLGLLLDS